MTVNTGQIELFAATGNYGGYHFVRVVVEYDTAGNPSDGTQPIINRGGSALKVWNTIPVRPGQRRTPVRIEDSTTGQIVEVDIPAGGDEVTPVLTRTANQLANWGIETRGDVHFGLSAG